MKCVEQCIAVLCSLGGTSPGCPERSTGSCDPRQVHEGMTSLDCIKAADFALETDWMETFEAAVLVLAAVYALQSENGIIIWVRVVLAAPCIRQNSC